VTKVFQNFFNFCREQGKIPDIFRKKAKRKSVVNCPVPVDNNIPEPSHRTYLFLHIRCDQPLIHQMQEDILIFSGDTQIEICIQDSADIKDILNGKFNPLVDAVLYKPQVPEFFFTF